MKHETKIIGTIFLLLATHLIWVYYFASYERKIVNGQLLELSSGDYYCQKVSK